MLQGDLDSRYADVLERALYNTVLSGMSLDGTRYFYVNPLEVWPEACNRRLNKCHVKYERQPWFQCACCPPNILGMIVDRLIRLFTRKRRDMCAPLCSRPSQSEN